MNLVIITVNMGSKGIPRGIISHILHTSFSNLYTFHVSGFHRTAETSRISCFPQQSTITLSLNDMYYFLSKHVMWGT